MVMVRTLRDFNRELANMLPGRGGETRRYYQLLAYSDNRLRRDRYYRTVLIPKRGSDEYRRLKVPEDRLKTLQRCLIPFLQEGEVSPSAFAYVRGKSLKAHGMVHQGQRLLVKLDLKDFFGSISFQQVFNAVDGALKQSGLAGTGVKRYEPGEPGSGNYNSELSWYFSQFCTLDNSLPQGAPTSPLLSNLVFYPLDQRILDYCQEKGIRYTRYSDDLFFSGDFSPQPLMAFVQRLLGKHGFQLNKGKTRVAGPGRCHRVTGVVVNEKIQGTRAYRDQIRQEVYYIGRYGLRDHLSRMAAKEGAAAEALWDSGQQVRAIAYLRGLLGRIGFILYLNPDDREFLEYKDACLTLLNHSQYI